MCVGGGWGVVDNEELAGCAVWVGWKVKKVRECLMVFRKQSENFHLAVNRDLSRASTSKGGLAMMNL